MHVLPPASAGQGGAGQGVLTLTDLLDGGLQVSIRFFDCEHEIGIGPFRKQFLQCG